MQRRKAPLIGILIILQFLIIAGCSQKMVLTDSNRSSGLIVNSLINTNLPVFINRQENSIIVISVGCTDNGQNKRARKVVVNFSPGSDIEAVGEVYVKCQASGQAGAVVFGAARAERKVTIDGDYQFRAGENLITLGISPSSVSELTDKLEVESVSIILEDGSVLPAPTVSFPRVRFGTVVRAAGQDGADTYRIPGLVTTNEGTLIAVYDIRYNNSKDLQEDIDIGMSRSTDGGRTWEPMKVIMDMGEYGGLPQNLNGIGDPCILYDHTTGTLWVAALWMSGSAPDKMLWRASQPGMTPQETGQFILVKSTDDGLTWSEPVNITSQIKDSAWQLLLQGPGRGITLDDGTLVFPAQFKADIGTKALDGESTHATLLLSAVWTEGIPGRLVPAQNQIQLKPRWCNLLTAHLCLTCVMTETGATKVKQMAGLWLSPLTWERHGERILHPIRLSLNRTAWPASSRQRSILPVTTGMFSSFPIRMTGTTGSG